MFKGKGFIRTTGRTAYRDAVLFPDKVITKNFEIQASAEVNGEQWHSVIVRPDVSKWIREQNVDLWRDIEIASGYRSVYALDVCDRLYTMMILKFS